MSHFDGVRLYVGNLPSWVQKSQIDKMFSRCGTVRDIYIPRHVRDGVISPEGKGYAFVEMAESEEAVFAIHMLNRMYGPGGLILDVSMAHKREPK